MKFLVSLMKTQILIFTLSISLLSSMSSAACTCNHSKSIKEEIERHNFIFKGTPIFADTIGRLVSFDGGHTIRTAMARITMVVEKSLKGILSSDTVQLITGIGSGDCGYHFVTGKEYFIFSGQITISEFAIHHQKNVNKDQLETTRKQYLFTTICTWTGPYHKEFESEIVRELQK